jgi:hypothetical protein
VAHLLSQHVHADAGSTFRMANEEPEALVAQRLGRRHEAPVAGPEWNLEEKPMGLGRALGDHGEFVRTHPGRVPRRDLASGEHVERQISYGERLTETIDAAGEFGEPDLACVRRADDPAGTVVEGQPSECERLRLVARSVVDPWEKMEVKLCAHPLFTTRPTCESFGATLVDNGMTTHR